MTRRVNREDHWMKTAEMNMAIKRKAFSSPGPEIEVLEKDQRRRNLETTVSGEHQWFCTDTDLIYLLFFWLCTCDAHEIFSYFSCLHFCFCASQLLEYLPVSQFPAFSNFSVTNGVCLSPHALQVVTDGENHRALRRLVRVWNLPPLVLEKTRWVKTIWLKPDVDPSRIITILSYQILCIVLVTLYFKVQFSLLTNH